MKALKYIGLAIIAAVFLIGALSSCYTQQTYDCRSERRATKHLNKALNLCPDKVHAYCGLFKPVIERTTEYIPGDTVTNTETEYVQDTVNHTDTVRIKTTRIIHDTTKVVQVVENLSRVLDLQGQLKKSEIDKNAAIVKAEKKQTQLSGWMWAAIIESALILAWVVKKIFF